MTIIQKVKLQPQRSFQDKKLAGLKTRTHDRPIHFILSIEKLVTDYQYSTCSLDPNEKEDKQNKLFKGLQFTINNTANFYHYRWSNKGIDRDEFISAFHDAFLKLCDTYKWHGEFYFYETFRLAMKRRATNVIEKYTKKKRTRLDRYVPLKENEQNSSHQEELESILVNVSLNQILSDPLFTDKERQLILLRYDNPKASLLDLARELGYSHHEPIRRMTVAIQKKVEKSSLFL